MCKNYAKMLKQCENDDFEWMFDAYFQNDFENGCPRSESSSLGDADDIELKRFYVIPNTVLCFIVNDVQSHKSVVREFNHN